MTINTPFRLIAQYDDAKPFGGVDVEEHGSNFRVLASGDWTLHTVQSLDRDMREIEQRSPRSVVMDVSGITKLDTSGAWLIERLRRKTLADGAKFEVLEDAQSEDRQGLLDVLRSHEENRSEIAEEAQRFSFSLPFQMLGQGVSQFGRDFIMACNILGACIQGAQLKASKHSSLRPTSIISQLDQMGRQAVPVIAVMSLLIGAILAQQGAYQLKFFGEELLTVDLVGILLLREIGVLLTAIMVAGRTGSAITAEIGTMKQREEIDALQVMGLNPVGVLIAPRLIALLIALPILTLLADLSGLLGAIIVCYLYVGITPEQFLAAFEVGVGGQPFVVGLVKAPFMALVVGLVATIEGLKVAGSAESLGRRTTESVVRAIFVVIFMDGVFAIFFASVGF